MTAQPIIDAGAAVRAAATLTESRFVAVGDRLDRAIGILTALTDTFAGLSAELEADSMAAATSNLSTAAATVGKLGRQQGDKTASLASLARLIGGIEHEALGMAKAIKSASGLTVHVKIEAAGLGAVGADFLAFAAEIGRSLTLAQQKMEAFQHELAAVAQQLAGGQADEQDFARRHAQAIEAIPRRLAASLAYMQDRSRKAIATAAAVGARAGEIKGQVGKAVAALQLGDTTRQRAEHVDEASAMIAALLRDAGTPAPGLIGTCCQLQAAQLADAADQLGSGSREILAALRHLAGDAREIDRLGRDAYGAARQRGSFLGELEQDVEEARRLLEDYRGARAAADRALAGVAAAAGDLQQHIRTISSMETDLRIMGLNTSLKCGRIGASAASLAVIAQELRAYAGQMAAQAETVMQGIGEVAATAGALTGAAATGERHDVEAVSAMMAESAGRLAEAGHSVEAALQALDRDSAAVAAVLGEAAGHVAKHDGIGDALKRAAAAFSDCAAEHAGGGDATAPIFAAIARRYTMQREREVHGRYCGGTLPEPAPPAAQDTDDMLF